MKKIILFALLASLLTSCISNKDLIYLQNKKGDNAAIEIAQDASKRFGGWVVKFKGMEVRFNAFAEMDKRVQSITIKNIPIDPEKIYTIMACERDGDPVDMLCRMKGVMDAKNA